MENQSISQHVLDICRCFFEKNGLNAFSYSRVYKNGTRSELWSDATAFDHTFFKAKYIVGAYTPKYFKKNERYSFLEKKVETYPHGLRERYRNQLMDQRDYFNHGHCFSILNHEEGYCEYFIFYAPNSNGMAANFYLNNTDVLEIFSQYFLNTAGNLILYADQHRICAPEITTHINYKKTDNSVQAMTPREKDVARLLITGATIKDVGVELCISPRTVESHVESLKLKYGCTRKSILVKQLHINKNSFY